VSVNRDLAWEACYNARDLGALPMADGGRTRRGAIVRADTLHRLTPAGRRAVLAYGIRTVIDLRVQFEVEAEPSEFPANSATLHYRNIPLDKYYPSITAMLDSAATREAVYCIMLDQYADAVADILRAIADAEPGGVVIHCQAGMDRTGIVAALLLRLAGVLDDAIVADYALSAPRLMPLYEQMAAEAGEAMSEPKPASDPETMRAMLAHVDGVPGGLRGYLRAAGLSDAELERLRARLSGT
jgi:protein-tyrosine phosphatase